jgi:hypothetical protein
LEVSQATPTENQEMPEQVVVEVAAPATSVALAETAGPGL